MTCEQFKAIRMVDHGLSVELSKDAPDLLEICSKIFC
jgi:hypothetical protein